MIGKERVRRSWRPPAGARTSPTLLRAQPELADVDVDALLDPAGYTGLAAHSSTEPSRRSQS